MKFITILLVLVSSSVFAQVAQQKLPKIRITSGVFTTKYELGEKDVSAKDVRAHLEKTNPEAYFKWRQSDNANVIGLVFAVVGLGGVIYGITADDSSQSAAGYVVGSSGVLVSLICTLVSSSKREKAATIYNRAAGY